MCVRDPGEINSSLNLRLGGGDDDRGSRSKRQDSQTLRKWEISQKNKEKQFCTFRAFVLVLDTKKKKHPPKKQITSTPTKLTAGPHMKFHSARVAGQRNSAEVLGAVSEKTQEAK